MVDEQYYRDIPNLYGETDNDPIKAFFCSQKYAYTAIVSAVMDFGGEPRKCDYRNAAINTLEGPKNDGFYILEDGRKIADYVAKRKIAATLKQPVTVNGHEVVLVDIVTYPLWHCLITGVNPFPEKNAIVLWKVNHNIIAPFIPYVRECGYLLTFIHVNEKPIDDAPTHNIIVFHENNDRTNRASIEKSLRTLAEKLPNVNYVNDAKPVFDDRYCLNQRLPQDPPCPPATVFNVDDLIISK